MSSPTDKHALRAHARAARQGIPAVDREPLALAAAERALALAEVAGATHVLGFAAAPEELDPAPLLDALRDRGASVCLPRITGPGALALHVCGRDDLLEEGAFGLRQPAKHAALADATSVDLVIVPGVAFDAHGGRLGFGGGYYDRLLSSMPHAFRIALAFEGQLVESVPMDVHDERVDVVVTPDRMLRAGHRIR